MARIEKDSLGSKQVPEDAYYGIQTLRAVENFTVGGMKTPEIFIRAYALIKKAAAIANMETESLDKARGKAIEKACDEVLTGKFADQFVIDVFQAGAGTSFNMNVNEVIANRALEILGKNRGDYESLSPNDHVNLGQSTNDTFPTALHLATLLSMPPLLGAIEELSAAFNRLGDKHKHVIKSGRTHLQDALPVTIGQEFSAYASALKRGRDQIAARCELLDQVALGGTATGTGAGSHPDYQELAILELNRMTGLKLQPAGNLFEALQSRYAVVAVSSSIKEIALELIRIANDLRLLSSGPTTGLAEMTLPAVQPGSSIMPGKVNPVMAECLDMVCFQVVGNDLTIAMASQAGQLELNVMTPVIMLNLLGSINMLANYLPAFTKKCVEGIVVDEDRCRHYIDRNPSLVVFLMPHIGYLEAAKIAKQALDEESSVKDLAVKKGLLEKEDAEKLFSPDSLLGNSLKNGGLGVKDKKDKQPNEKHHG